MLTLNRYGGGDYRIVTSSDLGVLMRYAAKRNRLTGKPVGLLVARGGHAWVMTGFQATADPALTSNYRLTYIKTMGPLWPKQKYRNGTSIAAGRLVLDEPRTAVLRPLPRQRRADAVGRQVRDHLALTVTAVRR